jgi:hypothetical protein
MHNSFSWFAVAGLALSPAVLADVHDFPSDDSEVVASVGFRDPESIGAFWSADRGDRVTETFSDPAGEITRVIWDLDITRQGLTVPLEWALYINDVEVTRVIYLSEAGPQQIDVSFDAIAAVGGEYTVSFECTTTVPGGGGSMDLRYAGAGPHQIDLIGAAGCYADCDESGELDFFDFLCFQNEFAAGTEYADCDQSGAHDFFDFLCFQNEFAAGCP